MGMDPSATMFFGWQLTWAEHKALQAEVRPTLDLGDEAEDEDYVDEMVQDYLESSEPLRVEKFHQGELLYLVVVSTKRRHYGWRGPFTIPTPTPPEPVLASTFGYAVMASRPGAWFLIPEYE